MSVQEVSGVYKIANCTYSRIDSRSHGHIIMCRHFWTEIPPPIPYPWEPFPNPSLRCTRIWLQGREGQRGPRTCTVRRCPGIIAPSLSHADSTRGRTPFRVALLGFVVDDQPVSPPLRYCAVEGRGAVVVSARMGRDSRALVSESGSREKARMHAHVRRLN